MMIGSLKGSILDGGTTIFTSIGEYCWHEAIPIEDDSGVILLYMLLQIIL